ncbi:MAG: ERCC4 domain-containing protein, partial [Dehalococcoidales bacterium]|nr:ERCC4 domain-containing protein [Dehalococcoidales bacterium]
LQVERTKLDVGDIWIPYEKQEGISGVCIERKTMNDFYSSISSNRLFDQLHAMMQQPAISILAVVGRLPIGINAKDVFIKNRIVGAMVSSILSFRVPVMRFDSDEELTDFINSLYKNCTFTGSKCRPLKFKKKPSEPDDILLSVLCSFPNVGIKKSESIIKKYGTLRKTFDATKDELRSVINEAVANSIIELMDYEYQGKSE